MSTDIVIKFRAWDEKNKRWLNDYEECYLREDGKVGYIKSSGGYESVDYFKPTGAIPSLFTGLQDKNGIDGYCGDISSAPLGREKYITIWDKSGWKLKSVNNPKRIISYYPNILRQEIVGNIYQNPELLNATP